MAKRVEFQFKKEFGGKVKNLDKPLALRLEGKKQGKIIADSLSDAEVMKIKEKELAAREKEIEKREKMLEKKLEGFSDKVEPDTKKLQNKKK